MMVNHAIALAYIIPVSAALAFRKLIASPDWPVSWLDKDTKLTADDKKFVRELLVNIDTIATYMVILIPILNILVAYCLGKIWFKGVMSIDKKEGNS